MNNKHLQHDGQLIPYEVQHKTAVTRRVHLRVGPDGALLVIAPKRMSRRAIHKMLQERAHKVARFLVDALDRQKELPRCDYIHGEEQLYLGENFPLEIVAARGRSGPAGLVNGCIRICTADSSPQAVKKQLIAWYRLQAQQLFSARIEAISENAAWIDGRMPAMRLRKMKRTWGSCSASGVITLNPRLIRTPPACVDYVIAHELCHLKEMNHGRAFYALQDALYPQWAQVRAHLRERAHIYLHE